MNTLFLFITSLFYVSHSFDMKYSLQKHKWNQYTPMLIANGNIDKHKTIIYYSSENKVLLSSTDLKGGVTLSDTYILSANFKINYTATESCLFSIDRKGKQKLAVCFEPAGGDAVVVTLDGANIPDGKLRFNHKIVKNERIKLLLSVNINSVTQIINCEVTEKKHLNANISQLIRLTDDMDLAIASGVGSSLTLGGNIYVEEMDLYSPVDVTTVVSLCPNLQSAGFWKVDGVKGDKGDKGDIGPQGERGLKGEGCKGEIGRMIIGVKGSEGERGQMGLKGSKGAMGLAGPIGPPGIGIKGEGGVPGEKGERGEPGLPAPPAPSCPTTVSPAAATELGDLKSILSDIKSIFSDFVNQKTEQMKYFIELSTKCNERLTSAELNILINNNKIEALKSTMLAEAQT